MTKRDRLVARLVLDAVADDPAVAVAGRQVGLGGAMHQLLAQAAVLDQGLDRDDRQAVLAGDRVQLLASGHADAVGDLAEHAGGRQAGQPGQVDRGLGMPGAAEHAPFLGHQRKQVAGPDEVAGLGRRVDDRPDRPRPLLGADARPARAVVHRHGVRRLVRGRVVVDHRAQLEPVGHLGQDRHAQLPAAVRDHELDDLGRDLLGRRDEVSLVLAVLVVDDDDDPPFLQGLERVLDLGIFLTHWLVLIWIIRRALAWSEPDRGNRRCHEPIVSNRHPRRGPLADTALGCLDARILSD